MALIEIPEVALAGEANESGSDDAAGDDVVSVLLGRMESLGFIYLSTLLHISSFPHRCLGH